MKSHVTTLVALLTLFCLPLHAQWGGCSNDTEPPVAVCDQHTVISLTSDGKATLYATALDDGSTDNCQIDKFLVARMTPGWCPYGVIDDTQFRPYTQFCCEDIGHPIMVIMRVVDTKGNFNDCMVEVTVQDKLPPSIHCPYNKTISCDDWYPESELYDPYSPYFGSASAYDNCGLEGIWLDVVGSTTCGQGSIKRIFTAVDWGGAQKKCTQHIYITDPDPFTKYDIKWPKDYQASGCGHVSTDPDHLPHGFDRPTWHNDDCAMIAAAYDDLTFKFVDGVCKKILRTWTVIDWCQFDPYNPYTKGIWTHVQVIKLADNEKPIFENCKDEVVQGLENDCKGRAVIDPQVWDVCTPKDELDYEYKVDIGDNGTIDIIRKDKPILDEVLPIGTHRVLWFVDDGCGNLSTCTYKLRIVDGKAPTPVCYAQLSTVVMPVGGMVTLWAKDFDASSFDNCTPANLLKFSFSSDVQEGSKTFTCDNVGTNNVQIWVTDKNGNQAYCNTWITIGDNQGVCPSMNPLTGNVNTFSGTAVAGASVELYKVMPDDGMDMDRTDLSNMDGSFLTGFGTTSFDRMIGVNKDSDPLEGISGIDLIMIQQHVTGIKLIEDPVALYAADVDNSGHVGIADLLMLRDAFLSNGRSLNGEALDWTFYPEQCEWSAASLTPDCNLMVEIDRASPPTVDLNFLGVKKGDVNGDMLSELSGRSNDVVLTVTPEATSYGTKVSFSTSTELDLSGLQLSMRATGNSYGLENQVIDVVNSSLDIDGLINVMWLAGRNGTFEAGSELFSITLEEVDAENAKSALNFRGDMRNRAFSSGMAVSNVRFEWIEPVEESIDEAVVPYAPNAATSNDESSVKVIPNPVYSDATIVFNANEECEAEIEIFSADLKMVNARTVDATKGSNTYLINGSDIEAGGVYYYRVRQGDKVFTGKFVKLQ